MSAANEHVPAHVELLETLARCSGCGEVVLAVRTRSGPAVAEPIQVAVGAFVQRLNENGDPDGPWWPVCAPCVRDGKTDELVEGVAECLS